MAKAVHSSVLKALLGKKVLFNGKFEWGERDRLAAVAEAQQGIVVDEIEASVDLLVLPEMAAGKTIQKKVLSLNSKGAAIQVVDKDAFRKMAEPTEADVLALIKGGTKNASLFEKAIGFADTIYHRRTATPAYTFVNESFDKVDLSGFNFHHGPIAFDHCSFVGTNLKGTTFFNATNCDFTEAKAQEASFQDVSGSRLIKAELTKTTFSGSQTHADFTGAVLDEANFSPYGFWMTARSAGTVIGTVFSNALMRGVKFNSLQLTAPDFDGADLSRSVFANCQIQSPSFRKSNLEDATLVGCSLKGANLSDAKLRRANFADADLTDARFDHADLTECNLRGATLKGVDLKKAENYSSQAKSAGSIGPALRELDTLATQARRIQVTFQVRTESNGEEIEVGVDSAGLKHGWGLKIPYNFAGHVRPTPGKTFSDVMLLLANMMVNRTVRYETVDIQSTKSPKGGKELRDLVLNGIAEAFSQPLPAVEELAQLTKSYRDAAREQGAADRERREAAKKLAEKQQTAAKKKIASKVAKEVGKVVDIATFLKALELRADKQKIGKATKMLKASKFQLFNDASETHLNGVVKSQTDPDLVYACRIESTGDYACCTQNLNICGGLRGSICKHLLVLIIGLVKAGELDPSAIDNWIAKSNNTKPELNKETMGEIFIRYKGAEAGEVDWRPTETVPEDYYTL